MKEFKEIMMAHHCQWKEVIGTTFIGEISFEKWRGSCIVGMNEDGWEHVSISPHNHRYTPNWDDMCRIKNLFWNDDEEAYQIHPKKSEYVNIQSNCLHIWKPIGRELGELTRLEAEE